MDESVKLVIDALKPVAEKIGQGAQALFEIYTRQMIAEGVAGLVGTGIALLVLIACIVAGTKLVKYGIKRNAEDTYHNAGFGYIFGACFGGGFIGLVALGFVVFTSIEATMKLINPQYYAIQRLICQTTGKCDGSGSNK